MPNSIAGIPSIVGEQFPDFAVNQIEQRQKIYGSYLRNPSTIQYLTNKNTWCNLASSVDIKELAFIYERFKGTSLESLIGQIEENKLAKSFVLSGGTISVYGIDSNKVNASYKEGISRSNSNSPNNRAAYGYGGLEFGQVPMPGILSATFRSENRGSLRTGEIRIKAFNKTQFDIIDTLFLRLGYTILFEWGWDKYIYNNGLYDNDTSLLGRFLDPSLFKDIEVIDQYYFLEQIIKAREKTHGNYDAMLAKVKNFNWTFNKDGSYDITLSVVSIGDVIESLKVNVSDSRVFITEKQKEEARKTIKDVKAKDNVSTEETIIAYRDTSVLAGLLYGYMQYMQSNSSNVDNKDLQVMLTKNAGGSGNEYFIKFASFLQVLKTYIIPTTQDKEPIVEIANSPVNKTNLGYTGGTLIYNHPDQGSCDLKICAINKEFDLTGLAISGFTDRDNLRSNLPLGDPFVVDKNLCLADLMNVYLNFVFILDTLEGQKNEEGSVALIDFLTAICDGINNALGNINKIAPSYDHDTNTIYFVDETPAGNRDWVVDPPKAKFELYGYNEAANQAGFIKDFNLKTELTPALSTAITVGAQANARPVGENQTAFSKWNIGLEDRIWKEKNPPSGSSGPYTKEEQQKAAETAKKNDKTLIEDYGQFLVNTTAKTVSDYGASAVDRISLNPDEQDKYGSVMNSFISRHNALWVTGATGSASSPTDVIGFIPINLSLTMDGLSGPKIYQRFAVDTKFLPSKYTDTLEFIVRGISHTIENNQWTTNIETFMVPKIIDAPTESLFSVETSTNSTAPTSLASVVLEPVLNRIAAKALLNVGVPRRVIPFIIAQILLETGHYKSTAFKEDNNLSGIRYAKQKLATPGSAAPKADGPAPYARYANYDDWARDYITQVTKGYGAKVGKAKPLEATTPEGFAHALKVNLYYQGPEADYARNIRQLYPTFAELGI